MKNIKYILLVMISFLLIPTVNAENFDRFTARTNFSNNINISTVESVIALISIPGEEDFREIELTRNNLYNYESTEIPTNAEFDSAYVKGDKGGSYTVTGKLTKNGSNATLDILVSIYTTTTTTTTQKVVTTQIVGDDDIIIVDSNGNVQTTVSQDPNQTIVITEPTTTLSESAKARMSLYKYIIIGIVGLLLVIGLMIIVKVIRTSNLM